MGLTMGQRKAVTRATATRYKRASKVEKGKILDELCAAAGDLRLLTTGHAQDQDPAGHQA